MRLPKLLPIVLPALAVGLSFGRNAAQAAAKRRAPSRPAVVSLRPSQYEYYIPHASSGSYPTVVEITVVGKGFRKGAKARWNGKPVETVFHSVTELLARVPFATVTAASGGPRTETKVKISVKNPAGSPSSSVPFEIVTTPID